MVGLYFNAVWESTGGSEHFRAGPFLIVILILLLIPFGQPERLVVSKSMIKSKSGRGELTQIRHWQAGLGLI